MAGHNFTPSDFYVYLHRRATDGRVFYVGKGTRKRAFSKFGRSEYWHRIVKKHGFFVEIAQDKMQQWWALELEMQLIAFYGKKNLCNMTDGGDGATGYKKSAETRKKQSLSMSGVKNPNFGLSLKFLGEKNPMFGKTHSESHKNNISQKLKGRITANSKKTVCSNGMIFVSASKAEQWLKQNGKTKASVSAISECCLGKRLTAYGYTWKYQDENS